jgi:hypothetical protein
MRAVVLLLLIGLPLLASVSSAQTGQATLSCTPPTQNTDGSPIVGTISYKFYRGTVVGTYPTSQTSATCGTAFTALPAGVNYFVSTVIVGGVESAFSNVASKVVSVAVPLPPGVPLPRSLAGPVFAVQTTDNALVLPQVGDVVAGVVCDPSQIVSQSGNTYMRIQVASVILLPGLGTAGLAVFGACN